MNKRVFLNLIGLTVMVMTFTMCKNQPSAEPTNPQEALAELIAGNERYINENSIHPHTSLDRVKETAPHQAPFAAVVGCSDSRVPVELLFDQGIGDIFVIRTAGNNVNSEMVMGSVDYAIEHGVNYFDTSPVYLQGQSEQATGIALRRHPRESYFLATKLSNFSNSTRENSMLMYKKSFENMQTDYFDYYLLHSIGGGGVEAFNQRYVDNGMIDFLMEERKAGRIRNLGFSFHGDKESFDAFMQMHEKYHWDFVQIQLNYVDWKHAGGRNTNAEYLQAELDKRGISHHGATPWRTSCKSSSAHCRPSERTRATTKRRIMGLQIRRYSSGRIMRTQRYDIYGASSG